ncbi:flagellar hook protein FlgE [Thermosulfurimonas dismutans]|uniref:Flagellar hook protein FlgE n=1 Tax=Thermosulfurimonas dismutans TaxID=999894 RepID=A0A179D5M6_9BACT|nr:flagellar hook-basal body complex protein [Thermosulfurimonas dismutans]OAQ21273.1 Flagellar hook protein FlgE [Thermosulfurimonas dismutans]
MSLLGSIYLGTSGVKTQSQGMRIAADNIGNLNTTGFKGSRGLFEDVFLEVSGEVFSSQKGLGSMLKDIDIDFSPGNLLSTDIPTDLAILGKGFFILKDSSGENFFSRDGQFLLAETENNTLRLVNSLGYSLLGADPGATPNGVADLSPIEIPKTISGRATERISLEMNLDARKEPEALSLSLLEAWDATNPDDPINPGNYEFITDTKVYDPTGVEHQLTIYFDTTDQNNQYEILVTLADPTEDWRGSGRYSGALLWGTLNFGAAGEIVDATFFTVDDVNTGSLTPIDLTATGRPQFTLNFTGTPQTVTLDLGFYFDATGSLIRTPQSVHMYGAPFAVYYQHQDGYPPGIFDHLEIDLEGVIRAYYSNQQSQEVARIFLADFTGSDDALKRVGGNLFKSVTGASPEIFAPGRSAIGAINSGALEGSNVDLATEMVNLITLQRAFQSNARVITTADQMLEDFLRAK